jgi:hypothetical protein
MTGNFRMSSMEREFKIETKRSFIPMSDDRSIGAVGLRSG